MSPKQDLSHVCLPLQFQICVSGAAAGTTVMEAAEKAERLGAAIARSGHILTTGATIGLPFFAAKGARSEGGMSIGFSPASSLREHIKKYRLPHCYYSFINYTGMNYVGRDQYLIQSSDAVITVGGRSGSLHEFTTALESGKVCGVLTGTGGTADIIPELMKVLELNHRRTIIYDDDPERLVKSIVDVLKKEDQDLQKDMTKNEHWFLEGKYNKDRRG